MKWEKKKLCECTEYITDGDHQPAPKADKGVHFIKIKDIVNNQVSFDAQVYVPQEYYDNLPMERKPQKEDVLYTVVGSFGIPSYVQTDELFCFERNIALLHPNKDIEPRFLYYSLKTPAFYKGVEIVANGSAQKLIPLSKLKDLKISVPDKEAQHRIADILSVYDNLIENNQKQIKLLEEATQRLYKEWFVNLRFPGHENTKIVDGVPEGWSRTNINEILTFHRGYDLTRNEMKAGRYPVVGSTTVIGYHNEFKIKGPGIVTGRSGSLGKYQFIWDNFWPHNTSLYISDYKDHNIFFVYSLLQTVDFASLNNGGAIPTLNRNVLSNIEVIEPTDELQEMFAKIAEPQYQKIKNLEKQNNQLKMARDALLPKLMSGEVEV